jgi:pimeloyl-ACP methyl ester carboxylesterase
VWRRLGTIAVHHHGYDAERELGYAFFEESEGYPAYPDIGQVPCLVFHGRRDDVIPLAAAEQFAAGKANVRLHVLDDEHDLLASLPRIQEESAAFLGL